MNDGRWVSSGPNSQLNIFVPVGRLLGVLEEC